MPPKPHMRMPVSLRRVCPTASFVGCADVRVRDVTHQSAECRPGMLFAALPGTRIDGAEFVGEAVARGAEAVLVERPLPDVQVPQCVVPSVRRVFAELNAALHGDPSDRLGVVGVTGTNGKTTVTWMVRGVLRAANRRCGLLGTVEYDDAESTRPATMTTPDAPETCDLLARIVENGGTHAALELSSHALDQDRVSGTKLDVAVVTNVTRDHFDYHHTHEAYVAAKARIVESLKPGGQLVANADDPSAAGIADALRAHLAATSVAADTEETPPSVVTFGIENDADVRADLLEESLEGTRFRLSIHGETVDVSLPLPARHNVSNALAAAAACRHLGLDLAEIARGLETLTVVPGRLERVDAGQPFDVFVDYAHTPDALDRVVRALRPGTAGRLICVFGAGGDRDRQKRPGLGRAAAGADVAIVTSDNPRSESPAAIVADVLVGLQGMPCKAVTVLDRATAIHRAVDMAKPGDCVLVAGKGHECEQIIGDCVIPFDDREVVKAILEARRPVSSSGAAP